MSYTKTFSFLIYYTRTKKRFSYDLIRYPCIEQDIYLLISSLFNDMLYNKWVYYRVPLVLLIYALRTYISKSF